MATSGMLLIIVVVVAAIAICAWLASRERRVSGSSQGPDETSKEWADNFEAASERMDKEFPDPPEEK